MISQGANHLKQIVYMQSHTCNCFCLNEHEFLQHVMLKIPVSENPNAVVISFINFLPPFLCWEIFFKGLLQETKSSKVLKFQGHIRAGTVLAGTRLVPHPSICRGSLSQ